MYGLKLNINTLAVVTIPMCVCPTVKINADTNDPVTSAYVLLDLLAISIDKGSLWMSGHMVSTIYKD